MLKFCVVSDMQPMLTKMARLDRRVKWLLLVPVVMMLVVLTSDLSQVAVVHMPNLLWLGYDSCRVWKGECFSTQKL
jgi:hypothetical protein